MMLAAWWAWIEARRRLSSGWIDKMLVVGLLCLALSGAAVVTQVGGTQATAVNIAPDSFAHPYGEAGQLPRRPGDPAVSPTVPATSSTAPTPTAPPPCPAPSTLRRPGIPPKSPIVIEIKKLGVDAQVEQAGLDHHGDMQVPVNACDVAWYKPGPVPGAAGDAVIDGHLDWTSGPSVFWNLHQLRRGDEIDIIQAGGGVVRFIVSRLRTVAHTTFQTGLFASTGPPMLSLYTCAGSWEPWARTYSERLIVDAVLVR